MQLAGDPACSWISKEHKLPKQCDLVVQSKHAPVIASNCGKLPGIRASDSALAGTVVHMLAWRASFQQK